MRFTQRLKFAHICGRATGQVSEEVAVSEGRGDVQWDRHPSHRDILKPSVFHRFHPFVATEGLYVA